MIYTTFARVYDRLMDEQLYDEWQNYVASFMPEPKGTLLELACGSGTLAVKLAQAGFQVTGLDLSEEMLALADAKIQAAHLELPLIQGDARDMAFDVPFDNITCFDDSICYLPDITAVTAVFQRVFAALKPGGLFLFDAHTPYQIDTVFPGYMYNAKFEDLAFMWTSYVGEVPHSIEHDLTFFAWDESIKGYQVLEETHHERTYPLATYLKALETAGFTDVEVSSDFGKGPVSEHTTRYFFKCRKAD
ncbi:MAG: class I SAM-dependent methyltransferase [Lactobacillus sp.]|jgi:ubiquinone/menaquinone biosynthesis C-methylase UbiE|nr:class I SAM-dependent methyltransferase [Lactobacillus sp.]